MELVEWMKGTCVWRVGWAPVHPQPLIPNAQGLASPPSFHAPLVVRKAFPWMSQ